MRQLDEISRVIGSVETKLDAIESRAEEDRNIGDRRHAENRMAIEASRDAVEEVRRAIAPLVDAVAVMKPVVEAYQIARWKITGALGLGLVALTVIWWFVEAAFSHFVTWILTGRGGG